MSKILTIIIFLFITLSCGGNGPEPKKEIMSRNVIILLDLSDRLILNQNQIELDKQLIGSIVEIYLKTIKDTIVKHDKDFSLIKDKFSIRIAEQKNSKINKDQYENILQFDFKSDKKDNYKFILKEFIPLLNNEIDKLYAEASSSKIPEEYSGADIWKFFNEDLESMLDNSPNAKNYLIILTDGYLYFEDYKGKVESSNRRTDMKFLNNLRDKNWEETFNNQDLGLIKPNKSFPNLKVAVMEVQPKDFWNEYDLIKKVWGKWFQEMKINPNSYLIQKSGNSNLSKQVINDFLK